MTTHSSLMYSYSCNTNQEYAAWNSLKFHLNPDIVKIVDLIPMGNNPQVGPMIVWSIGISCTPFVHPPKLWANKSITHSEARNPKASQLTEFKVHAKFSSVMTYAITFLTRSLWTYESVCIVWSRRPDNPPRIIISNCFWQSWACQKELRI